MASPASTRIVLSGFIDPRTLSGAAAWYDAADANTIIKSSTNLVSLWADQIKGGNGGKWGSGNVALYGNGTPGGSVGFTALTAQGLGDFTVVADVAFVYYASLDTYLFSGGANSFDLYVGSTGTFKSELQGVGSNTASSGTVALATRAVMTYVRSGGNLGTYYINGVAAGTTVDTRNYTVGISAAARLNGSGYRVRIYNATALNASEVASDAAGTVQAGITLNADFTIQSPNAASFVATTGQTVTINTPALIGWFDATNGLALNGVAGNYATAPDAAAISIVGDIGIFGRFVQNDWTPAGEINLGGKWTTTGSQKSYALSVTTAGALKLYWSADGSTVLSASSTANLTLTDLLGGWAYATMDVNDGGGNRVIKFYYAADAGVDTEPTWTQLGATVTAAGATTIFDGTALLQIGATDLGTSGYYGGVVNAFYVRNGYDGAGSVVFALPFGTTPKLATSVAASTGQIVTINTTGDFGARIQAPRDVCNMTSTKRPVHVSEASNGCYNYPGVGLPSGIDRDCVYSDGSTASRRIEWTPGTAGAIAGQAATLPLEFYCPASNPGGFVELFDSAAASPIGSTIWAFQVYMNSSGWLVLKQSGADGTINVRAASHQTFRATYSGTWVRVSIAFATGDSATLPVIYCNGTDISASFALSYGSGGVGVAPNWMPTSLSTVKWTEYGDWPAGYYVPHSPILGALSSAEAIAWSLPGGALPAWATVVSGNAVNKITGDSYSFATVGTWAESGTGSITADPANNELDVVLNTTNEYAHNGITAQLMMTGRRYSWSVTIRNWTGTGSLRFQAGGSNQVLGDITGNGTYAYEFTATADATNILLYRMNASVLTFSVYQPKLTLLGRIFTPVLQPSLTVADAGTNALAGTITTGNYPILYKPGSRLWFDGVDDALQSPGFALTQPCAYFLTVRQVSWALNDIILDGLAAASGYLYQSGTTPRLRNLAGSGASAESSDLSMSADAIVTSILNQPNSKLRIGRNVEVAGSAGTGTPNGITIGSGGSGGAPANVSVPLLGVFDVAPDSVTQDKVIRWVGRQKGIAV